VARQVPGRGGTRRSGFGQKRVPLPGGSRFVESLFFHFRWKGQCFMNLRFRSLGPVSLVITALLASACGDDADGSTSGGGSGGGTTSGSTASSSVASTSGVTATVTATATSSSSSSGGGDGGAGTGGIGQGGDAQGGGGEGAGGEAEGGGGSGTGGEGGTALLPRDLFVASNPLGRDADAALRVPFDLGATESTHLGPADIVSLQNVALSGNGDGWISYDIVGGTGGLMFVTGLESLATGSLGAGARRIQGPNTGLVTPKGVRVIGDTVLVADTTSGTISAFDITDMGDMTPVYVIDDFDAVGRAIWDFDYDEANDILYAAATDGIVVAFDEFSTDNGQRGPSRTFTPSASGSQISVNLHGIEFVEGGLLDPDVLVLTDVGDAGVTTDGQLFTIADPDLAEGITNVRARVNGPNSLLGNPVDLEVDDGSVFIAEKSNDRILRYDNIAGLTTSGDAAAAAAYTTMKPESVAIDTGFAAPLHIVNNPTGRDADGLVRIDALFLAVQATLGTPGYLQSIESMVLDTDGNAFVTLDVAGARGSILWFEGLSAAPGGTPILGGTRRIEGEATGLFAPKGLQLASINGEDVVIVADVGGTARDIKLFAADGAGDVAPLTVVDDLGADRAPWDIDYDAASDRLYVACTDGTVLVYDDFSTGLGDGGPDREFTPAVGGADIATNLHGIEYLADSDILVLSDVGDANVATDGRLYTIAGASTAEGLVDVRARVMGNDTLLGNPVDLAVLDGAVYVAEKSNDRVLRYDGIAALTGEITAAANDAATVTKPESVFVHYE
jgi:hypothetical protein